MRVLAAVLLLAAAPAFAQSFTDPEDGALDMSEFIVDYKGTVIGRHQTTDDSFVGATIDVEALRQYRQNNMGIGNFLKDLRTEQFRLIYDKPVYPKNKRLKGKMPSAAKLYSIENEILQDNVRQLQKRGVYTAAGKRK